MRLFFIGTSDPRINAARVADRVIKGGHSVPIDNSVDGAEARLCARTEAGLLRKVYAALPPWVALATAPLRPHSQLQDLRASGSAQQA